MTNPTLERAARALCDETGADWDAISLTRKKYAVTAARAVLMAVRDGSPEVFAAMDRAHPLWPSSHCDNRRELERSANEPRVRAMIDAILAEGE
jgi:hypothetical protein